MVVAGSIRKGGKTYDRFSIISWSGYWFEWFQIYLNTNTALSTEIHPKPAIAIKLNNGNLLTLFQLVPGNTPGNSRNWGCCRLVVPRIRTIAALLAVAGYGLVVRVVLVECVLSVEWMQMSTWNANYPSRIASCWRTLARTLTEYCPNPKAFRGRALRCVVVGRFENCRVATYDANSKKVAKGRRGTMRFCSQFILYLLICMDFKGLKDLKD